MKYPKYLTFLLIGMLLILGFQPIMQRSAIADERAEVSFDNFIPDFLKERFEILLKIYSLIEEIVNAFKEGNVDVFDEKIHELISFLNTLNTTVDVTEIIISFLELLLNKDTESFFIYIDKLIDPLPIHPFFKQYYKNAIRKICEKIEVIEEENEEIRRKIEEIMDEIEGEEKTLPADPSKNEESEIPEANDPCPVPMPNNRGEMPKNWPHNLPESKEIDPYILPPEFHENT